MIWDHTIFSGGVQSPPKGGPLAVPAAKHGLAVQIADGGRLTADGGLRGLGRIPHHPAMKQDRTQIVAGVAASSRSTVARARAPGRPVRAQADAARQCILDAALQHFLARGFAAASMEGIARESGVAKLTVYRHFETKEQLFVEVARRAQLSVRERLGTMADRGAPLEQVLREIIAKLHDGFTHPDYLAVMRLVIAESGRFPKLGRAMLDDSSFVAEPLVEYLQDLKDRKQIDIDSPYDAATQIAGLASGAGRYVLIPPSRHPASRRRTVESLVSLFTRAWRVGPH